MKHAIFSFLVLKTQSKLSSTIFYTTTKILIPLVAYIIMYYDTFNFTMNAISVKNTINMNSSVRWKLKSILLSFYVEKKYLICIYIKLQSHRLHGPKTLNLINIYYFDSNFNNRTEGFEFKWELQ